MKILHTWNHERFPLHKPPKKMLNITQIHLFIVIMFLVVQYPGNQVGPVSTSIYSCHTHVLCPSILHCRVEHKRYYNLTACPSPLLSHSLMSLIKNKHTSTLTNSSLKSMELWQQYQHMHVSQPSLYIKHMGKQSSHSPRICRHFKQLQTSPNQHLIPATQVQNGANNKGCKY